MKKEVDLLLVNPGNREQVYQKLGSKMAAVEPPYLAASFAAYLKNQGIGVQIIDANAQNLSPQETAKQVEDLHPLLAAVIVYGAQPSASTQNMTAAGKICHAISETGSCRVVIGGLHPSALPERTFKETAVDFVIEGEEQLPLEHLIEKLKSNSPDYSKVPGLWFRDEDKQVRHNPRSPLLMDLDRYLPTAAWELLDMDSTRAHNWHCFGEDSRSPYAAIYTSLGCPYSCEFCCINVPFSLQGERHMMREKSPEAVVNEMEFLAKEYGIRNLKIIDELFVFKEDHYMKIVDEIIKRRLDLNIWAYARVDTVKPENLEKMKEAGINWLALGIESGDQNVRKVSRKRIQEDSIETMVKLIRDAGINVGANYIFGLPEDNHETMQKTLDLALGLNTEWANFYCAMAYPGSPLYTRALQEGWELPREWHGYSQHAFETQPLPTKYLSAAEVLKFRDEAFNTYFKNPEYIDLIEKKFGEEAKEEVQAMTKTKLRRKILE